MIRNFLFSLIFFSGIILISIIFLPSLFLPKSLVLFGGKLMGHWSAICLKIFLSTKIIIKGKENIIKNKKFFIASSHQSMFETFFLQTILNHLYLFLKRIVMDSNIWLVFEKIGSISIKRNQVTKDNLGFFDHISKIVNQSDRPLIIFPQGTRVLPNERPPFKKGAFRIYEQLNIVCQPVAINSGYVWPKKGFKNGNRDIVISILKPIPAGLDRENFIQILEKAIYSELDTLN